MRFPAALTRPTCVLAAVAAAALATGQATFTPLGILSGRAYSQATCVSADATMAGGVSGYDDHAFGWKASLGIFDLGVLGGSWSKATGCSGDGTCIVGSSSSALGNRAFRWSQATGMENLGTPAGATATYGYAVSYDGATVVGSAFFPGEYRPFRWTPAVGLQDLGVGIRGEAYGVSGDGSVVVGYAVNTSTGSQYAFRWTEAAGLVNLGLPQQSQASAVSRDGASIAGGFGSSTFHAFLWTQSAGYQDLGLLAGSDYSWARGISADGLAVAGVSNNPSRPFLWTRNTGMIDLKQALIAGGASEVQNWTLLDALGVACARGRVFVVGYGVGFDQEGFLASLPDPAAVNPSAYTLYRGQPGGGGLADLASSDDSYLTVQNGLVLTQQESPVDLIVTSSSTILSPSRLMLVLEMHANTVGLTQKVSLYNYQANAWELVDTRPAPRYDASMTIEPSGDPSRFVNPSTGAIRARAQYRVSGPIATLGWNVSFDQFIWRVVP